MKTTRTWCLSIKSNTSPSRKRAALARLIAISSLPSATSPNLETLHAFAVVEISRSHHCTPSLSCRPTMKFSRMMCGLKVRCTSVSTRTACLLIQFKRQNIGKFIRRLRSFRIAKVMWRTVARARPYCTLTTMRSRPQLKEGQTKAPTTTTTTLITTS